MGTSQDLATTHLATTRKGRNQRTPSPPWADVEPLSPVGEGSPVSNQPSSFPRTEMAPEQAATAPMDTLATLALATYPGDDYGESSERPWKRPRWKSQTALPESSTRPRPGPTSSSMHDAELLLDFSRAMGQSPPSSRPSTMYGDAIRKENGRARVAAFPKSTSEPSHQWHVVEHVPVNPEPGPGPRFWSGTINGIEVSTAGRFSLDWDCKPPSRELAGDAAWLNQCLKTARELSSSSHHPGSGSRSDPTVAPLRPPFPDHTSSNDTPKSLRDVPAGSPVGSSAEHTNPRRCDEESAWSERGGSITFSKHESNLEDQQPSLQFSQSDGSLGSLKMSSRDADHTGNHHSAPHRSPLEIMHHEWPRHFPITIHSRDKRLGRRQRLRRERSNPELSLARFDDIDASTGVDLSVWEDTIELPKSAKQPTVGVLEPSLSVPATMTDADALSSICARCQRLWGEPSPSTEDEVNKWIGCDWCRRWFHCACVDLTAQEADDIGKYSCAECQQKQGHTTWKRKSGRAHTSIDYARLNEGVVKTSKESPNHPYIDPIKNRTIKFLPDRFARLAPEVVTLDFFEKGDGMQEPMVIPAGMNPQRFDTGDDDDEGSSPETDDATHASSRKSWFLNERPLPEYAYESVFDDGQDKLDMVIPQHLTVRRVAELYGPHEKVEVIDVKSQGEAGSWNLKKWADYYEGKKRTVVRNVISLEISHSKLGRLVRRPKVVRQLDLVDSVWPPELKKKGDFPKVQLYCLMSVADSYTDFHIDFGGSSVFYHILKGKKTFLFIPPKPKNLKKYEQWCLSPTQNQTFLPDETKECIRVDLAAGDTMLIPSGWIHAVWTPEDSLVIGGNFLTRLHFSMQLQIAEIEKTTKVPRKFRHPHFQRVLWFTAIKYLASDPLPPAVEKILCEGGTVARNGQPGDESNGDDATLHWTKENSKGRSYSEYELNGLPDLGRYLLRTVLISLGKITDGITADTRLKVTRAIPKGHGEPLEIIKRFAWWTAWKRGNEVIPEWAHPNAEAGVGIPKSMDKKPSAAALKKMEREAAAAARREAPRRKSERGKAKAEAAAKEVSVAENTANLKTEDDITGQPSQQQGEMEGIQLSGEIGGEGLSSAVPPGTATDPVDGGGLVSAVPPGTATDAADGNAGKEGVSGMPREAIHGEPDPAATATSPDPTSKETQPGSSRKHTPDAQNPTGTIVTTFKSTLSESDHARKTQDVEMSGTADDSTVVTGNLDEKAPAHIEVASHPAPSILLPSIAGDERAQRTNAEPPSPTELSPSHGQFESPKNVGSSKRGPSPSTPESRRPVKKGKIQVEVPTTRKGTKRKADDAVSPGGNNKKTVAGGRRASGGRAGASSTTTAAAAVTTEAVVNDEQDPKEKDQSEGKDDNEEELKRLARELAFGLRSRKS
ncbi:MAG: hypothetical protein M1823_002372 [Watsoniomyces obsoletus]|nr:MAG: hypothetical protein M1823_002372 [Watsoniomyces obsoletus]